MQKFVLASLLVLVFLASCKLIDDDTTDPGINDTEDPVLELLTPNGGESIAEGSSYSITWDSDATQKVYIAFTFDNEVSWYIIADSISNTGVFEWFPVPNKISDQCKIKVSTVDQTLSDVSESNFSITRNSNESIVLNSPNGNEEVEAGSQLQITWYSSGISSVKLEYTLDNGTHWTTIAVDSNNTGIFYWEPVPDTSSTLAKIRIMDAVDGTPADESDSVFAIVPEPFIAVTKPNGGETWTVGSSQRIEWYAENIQDVRISYTTNNGSEWFVITESTPSIGYYVWNEVPAVYSQLCKIRINDAEDGLPSDVSNNTFTISDPISEEDITILEPNGGEVFEAGTVQDISWNSNGIDSVKIELSTNSGSSWITLEDNYENTGGYQWQINSELNSPQSYIRVSDAADGEPSDQSDDTFRIKPIKSIKVTYPTNGLVFNAGTPVVIQWESSGIEYVGIRYTYTNGQPTLDYSGFEILESSKANQGYYEANFSLPSDQYYVEVYDAETGSPKSRSEGNFKITAQVFPSIEVLIPNGGEEWLTSDPLNRNVYEISWISSEVDSVKIQYSLDGGANWTTIENSVPSNGLYNWEMPQQVDFRSANALVRISSVDDESFFDDSDNVFSIHPQSKLLQLVYPIGGEFVFQENPTDPLPAMTWHSAGIFQVKIELTLDNGVSWIELTPGMQSVGILAFDLSYPSSTNARIRITDVSADAGATPMVDMSDAVFNYNIKEGD